MGRPGSSRSPAQRPLILEDVTRELPVDIDRSSTVPLYQQLATQLTAAIHNGTLRPGDPIEKEIDLAHRLDLSRPTVRQAICEMVTRGLLIRRRGIGTTVAHQVTHRRGELTSLYDDLLQAGHEPRTELLTLDTDSTYPPAAEALHLPPHTGLVKIERLRYMNDKPLAILCNWLPPAFAEVTATEIDHGSLYAWLRSHGQRPCVAQQTIGARAATAHERRHLRLEDPHIPVLTMARTGFDATGTPLEYGEHRYRADRYTFGQTVHES